MGQQDLNQQGNEEEKERMFFLSSIKYKADAPPVEVEAKAVKI